MLFFQSNSLLALLTCLGFGGLVLVRQQNRGPTNVDTLIIPQRQTRRQIIMTLLIAVTFAGFPELLYTNESAGRV